MSIFNKKVWPRKFLASLLVIAFLISALVFNVLLPPKPAKAINATLPMQIVQWIQQIVAWYKDYSNQAKQLTKQGGILKVQEWFKSDTLDRRSERESWNQTRKDMLDDLVNDILGNIKDMGGGKTAFVSDWEKYIGDLTDQVATNFIDTALPGTNTCSSADGETLGQKVQEIFDEQTTFPEEVECPIKDLAGFQNDFENGGWETWDAAILPAGNLAGVLLLASDELMYEMGQAYTQETFKLSANQGFQGTPDTPGIIQSYSSQRASMMDLDYLLNSADLETYFGSVADAFINQIINQGLSKLNTSVSKPITQYPPTLSPETADLDFIKTNYNYATLISDQLALTREDLQAFKDAGGLADAQIALADQAILDINNLVIAMEQAMDAEGTGNSATINAAVANAKNAYNTSLSSLQALLGTPEIWLQKISPLIDTFDSQIVDQTNKLYCLRSPGGCIP